jgi:hypothetical protein
LNRSKQPNWKGFHNVEQSKEPESRSDLDSRELVPACGNSECDHLSYDFINDDPLCIMPPQMLDT